MPKKGVKLKLNVAPLLTCGLLHGLRFVGPLPFGGDEFDQIADTA